MLVAGRAEHVDVVDYVQVKAEATLVGAVRGCATDTPGSLVICLRRRHLELIGARFAATEIPTIEPSVRAVISYPGIGRVAIILDGAPVGERPGASQLAVPKRVPTIPSTLMSQQ